MNIKKTITSIFAVPTLKIPSGELRENNFVNAYIKDVDRDIQYEDAIYLLFLPTDIPKFREFIDNEYERSEQIIEDYDYSGGFVVIIYKLDPKYRKDFNIVKTGLYSKTSKDFQKLFPKVIKIKKNGLHRDEVSLQHRVFTRSPDLIEYWESKVGVDWEDDQEVWSGYYEEEEILCIEDVKEILKYPY